MINESEIGKTIKYYRKKKKLTLQELADRTGFSKGYLSKLEKSDKAPPLSTLGTIANVLDVTPSILLGATPQGKRISFVKANQRHLFAGNGSGFGYYYESIAHDYHDKSFEPFILTIPVDAQMIMFQHNHEEMLFVLEGTMKFKHGDQEYIVEKGDCVYFDANIPHFGQALGNEEAVCLVVMHEFKED